MAAEAPVAVATSSELPKPVFKTCDETSLRLTWDVQALQRALVSHGGHHPTVGVQYKEVHEDWTQAKTYNIPSSESGDLNVEVLLKETDLVDLKPGTPYYVRFVLHFDSNIEYGPATVFDTKPIDCTPKRKTCVIA